MKKTSKSVDNESNTSMLEQTNKSLLDQAAQHAHVGAALSTVPQFRHDFAHVFHAGSTGLGEHGFEHLGLQNDPVAQPRRQRGNLLVLAGAKVEVTLRSVALAGLGQEGVQPRPGRLGPRVEGLVKGCSGGGGGGFTGRGFIVEKRKGHGYRVG